MMMMMMIMKTTENASGAIQPTPPVNTLDVSKPSLFLFCIVFKSFLFSLNDIRWSCDPFSWYLTYCAMSTFQKLLIYLFHILIYVQFSDPYNAIFQTQIIITFFFNSLLNLFKIALSSCWMHSWPLRSYSLSPLYKSRHLIWVIPNYETYSLAKQKKAKRDTSLDKFPIKIKHKTGFGLRTLVKRIHNILNMFHKLKS